MPDFKGLVFIITWVVNEEKFIQLVTDEVSFIVLELYYTSTYLVS